MPAISVIQVFGYVGEVLGTESLAELDLPVEALKDKTITSGEIKTILPYGQERTVSIAPRSAERPLTLVVRSTNIQKR